MQNSVVAQMGARLFKQQLRQSKMEYKFPEDDVTKLLKGRCNKKLFWVLKKG